MPGKNQQKRLNKKAKNALLVWQRETIGAKMYHNALTEAVTEYESVKETLSTDEQADIESSISQRFEELKSYVLASRHKFAEKVGEENVELFSKEASE
jgi:hypothetical protein